ncbi:Superfamily I DNA and/or RNA helicase [Bacillus sp. OV322]|uniref:DEAD/DEAH box helicase n=1 Tax=Bacillus sp. OV322 TaxID=1882764 RepID=UPI0008EC9916|nr:AAA domain-containing protein [Bacillus sp. OV322]SFC69558.1 Superfamily I DNA and/or RNA helicase [Bacillus sp. OV322]
MNITVEYIKEWQQALDYEISHLKKFGSTKYRVFSGRLLTAESGFTYYFDSNVSLKIPVGTIVKLERGKEKSEGRILSSEGKSIILTFERNLGELIGEANLLHDPWELLEQLIERLQESKKNKTKRLRIKRLMNPSMPAKHPEGKTKSSVEELYLRSKYNPVTYVWGPPGTGKTYTLARTAANAYFKGKNVLILSHSNQAVDVLMKEISGFIKLKKRFNEGEVLRYGSQAGDELNSHEDILPSALIKKEYPGLLDDKNRLTGEKKGLKQDLSSSFSKRDSSALIEIEKKIARVLEKIRQKEIHLAKEACLIGTTLAKAAGDPAIYEREFDLVIVDEASMAYIPQAAFASALGSNVIISGDFKQLPPIAASRSPLVNQWLKEDIFHKSGVADSVSKDHLHPHLFLLKQQRRMHPDISSFTNRYIYHSLVEDHKSVLNSRTEIVSRAPFNNSAAVLLDTSFTGAHCTQERMSKSRFNPMHLLLSFQLIHEAYEGGSRSIGYVAPYRAQAVFMQNLLADLYSEEMNSADIIAATVHKLQGSERDILIFDTVDSYPESRAGMLLTGKESERLINVAVTRTKGKFIQVSDRSFIKKSIHHGKTLRQLVDHQEKYHNTAEIDTIGKWIKNQHPKLKWMHAKKTDKIFSDINAAEKSIIVSLPEGTILSSQWKNLLKLKSEEVRITVLSGTEWSGFGKHKAVSQNVAYPFVIIDETYFWLGLPLDQSFYREPPFVTARLDSSVFCSHFISQMPGIAEES